MVLDPFISVWTYVKDPKVCIYNHKVSAIFLPKGPKEKNVLEYRKGACFTLCIHNHTYFFLEGGSLTDCDVQLLTGVQNDLAVNQFLICISGKVGKCFMIFCNYLLVRM